MKNLMKIFACAIVVGLLSTIVYPEISYIPQKLYNSYASQKRLKAAQELVAQSVDGYEFVKFTHFIYDGGGKVINTKTGEGLYYGEQAAIHKGKSNYCLVYSLDGKSTKKLYLKEISLSSNGIILKKGYVCFAVIDPRENGCDVFYSERGVSIEAQRFSPEGYKKFCWFTEGKDVSSW